MLGLAALAVCCGGTQAAAAQPEGQIRTNSAPIAGSYIVMLNPGVPADLARQYGGAVKRTYSALNGFAVSMNEQQARRLAGDPRVSYVEQDGIAHITDTQENATWGLDRIDQKNLPLDSKYTYTNKGDGATVYVVDTGVYFAHPEFGGRAKSGYDFIDNDSDASDCQGHGTHVAGTIGSATYGVAKNTNIVAVRVLNCQGTGEWNQIIGGIDWVAKNGKKPGVLNMSLGGGAQSSVDDAVKRAVQAGFVNAVAAGNNNGADACNTSPARTPEAITVGATDNSDNRSSFSNIGTCLDIFGPGSNITSTKNGGGTAQMSGTSMATPHVAGAAALVLTANPGYTPQQVRDALVTNATPDVVKNAGSGSPNKLLYTGFLGGGPAPGCGAKSNTTPATIPDAGSAVTSEIQVSGCSGNAPAVLPVRVDIDHTFTADLAVDLIGPSGAVYPLRTSGGIGDATGIHLVYNVNAASETANGTWKLRVQDVYKFDTGALTSWSLDFGQTTVLPAKQPIPGNYIVVLKDGARIPSGYTGRIQDVYTKTLNGYSVHDMSAEQAERLAKDPAVRAVYQDGTARIADTQNNPPSWGQDRVDQKPLPLDSKYTYNNTGDGVTAYVIDTGIAPANQEWEGRASYGYDFVDNDAEAQDCHGHGSHVSGTIAGKTYGLAKKAKIVAVRALGCGGTAPDSAAVSAMEWVAKNAKKPAVVNMSIGMDTVGVGDAQAKALVDAGITVAVAAGNSSADACNTSPARVPEVITAGSTERNDARSSFSNFGSCVDIFAPGGNIVSTGINSGSATMSGTSMASPHVAGAAALYLNANPAATPQQVRDALVNNANNGVVTNPGSGSPNKLLYTGFIGGQEPPTGDFTLGTTPSSGHVEPGKYISATVTSKAGNQGPQSVQLTASGLPTGATATFQPSTFKSGDTAKLTIETSTATPAGDYKITISGQGTSVSTEYTLTVAGGPSSDLKLSVSPGSGTTTPGGFLSATVAVTGGSDSITLDATGSGLPLKPFFNPQTVNPGGSSQITIVAPFQTGTYKITITGTDTAGKTGSTEYSLTVQ
jgi:subtilisin family serine protease